MTVNSILPLANSLSNEIEDADRSDELAPLGPVFERTGADTIIGIKPVIGVALASLRSKKRGNGDNSSIDWAKVRRKCAHLGPIGGLIGGILAFLAWFGFSKIAVAARMPVSPAADLGR
ncbi:hypothetical protein [Allorhodopirellula solitaria]|uniref:Uncharacterized protein n=1 Tax=Allorhodopirellula solitaria TaxID=2527987 RepID=A0A5C5Y0V4_9BACT|nr:hypothetical protein [Allorhodopirellula solitaria]TWT67222.1 hypothetical protein CA85_20710 [Allorhodopirellula solitaria]